MRKLFSPLAILFIAATSGGASECGEVIEDPGFDAWCGSELCKWQLEAGEIRRAATWHKKDAGVELVGDHVAISQLAPASSTPGDPVGPCLAFELIANVDDRAEVRLQMDVDDDGSLQSDERIPTSEWRALSYRVRLPATFRNVRFRLIKTGGAAVLANIGASYTALEECPAATGRLQLLPGCETVGTPGGSCE